MGNEAESVYRCSSGRTRRHQSERKASSSSSSSIQQSGSRNKAGGVLSRMEIKGLTPPQLAKDPLQRLQKPLCKSRSNWSCSQRGCDWIYNGPLLLPARNLVID